MYMYQWLDNPCLSLVLSKPWLAWPLRYQTIILNVLLSPRLNLLEQTAIHQLGIDILKLLQNSGSTPDVDKVNTIQEDDTSDQALRDACLQACRNFPALFKAELGCLKDVKLKVAFRPNVKSIFCKIKPFIQFVHVLWTPSRCMLSLHAVTALSAWKPCNVACHHRNN